jgi:uncharacterized DUF497 family protein
MSMIFEWDERKAQANIKKHGISFTQAAKVFEDQFAVSIQDRVENNEQRWQTIGVVDGVRLLLVAHTLKLADVEIVRIISARKATNQERKLYEHR